MKKLLGIFSYILVLSLVCNMLPMSVFAENMQANTSDMTAEAVPEETTQPVIVEELPQKRTEYGKQFRLSNGLYLAVAYPEAVHYQKNGIWAEIDNTLIVKNGNYTNTEGVWNVHFPQQLSSNKSVVIEKDGYTLSFAMAGELRNTGLEIAGAADTPILQSTTAETVPETTADTVPQTVGETIAETISEIVPEDTAETAAETIPESTVAAMERITVDTETVSVSGMQLSTAIVTPVDATVMRESAEHPETVVTKNLSRLRYDNVFADTNIHYDLQSNTVKESIEMKRYNAQLRGYRYTLDTGGMVPVLAEDGKIEFYTPDKTQVVMVMPAPFMVDANMAYSHDVQVNLTGSGSIYTLTYLLPQSWLADSSRAWPVILDPVVQAQSTASNIVDQNVYSLSSTTAASGVLQCGYRTEVGISRAYLKYDKLPPLSNADVIVEAQVRLYKVGTSTGNRCVSVHKVLENWTEGAMNWSNMADYDTTVEDYLQCQNEGYYHWDVTDLARGWYEGENTGMMFKLPDSVEQAGTAIFAQFWSSDYSIYQVDEKPALFIYFRNNNGLEGYWDYTASSSGRAGTGYVNDFTGNMVWIHSDIGFGGNRMPVNIQHVYNANDCGNNTFGMGYGWRTNFNQRVYQWPADSNYYVWEDSDGTSHYFYYDSEESKYVDEDGLELSLTATGSGNSKYVITNKNGNTTHFDTYGRLTKIQNNQQTKSNISVTYTTTSGYLISSVTDGAGRVYSFTYSGNLLSRISFKGSNNTEHSYVTFGYSGSNLTRITDKDTEYCSFTYTGNLLTQAQDIDGYKLVYTYNQTENTVDTEKPNRVIKICEYDGTTAGGEINIEYAHNQTTFKDHNNNVIIKQFNDFGNTICVQDNEGHAEFSQYSFNTADDAENNTSTTAKGNQLKLTSNMQNTVGNLLRYSNLEADSAISLWTLNRSGATRVRTTEDSYIGNSCMRIDYALPGTNVYALGPTFQAQPGKTYTLSAYVKSEIQAYMGVTNTSTWGTTASCSIAATQEWQRVQTTFTNNTSEVINYRPSIRSSVEGSCYVDCVQVEEAVTASRYNLVENGDFTQGTTSWTLSGFTSATASSAAAPQLNTTALSATGSPTATRQATQTVYITGAKDDTLVLSGWAKGDSAPLRDSRTFGMTATFNYTDGTTSDPFEVSFNPDADSSINWQYAAIPIVAGKAYNSVTVKLCYDYNVNTAYFDGIQLYKEEFGSSYTYDEDGNVTSVVDLQKQKTTYEYSDNDLTKMVMPTGASYTYTYDDYHNVKTATSAEKLVYSFTYDQYGNNTAVSITGDGGTISSSAKYTNNGNTLESTTDALGKTTTYGYNAQTNALEWVQYPEDTDQTKTVYTYDEMYRIATAEANVTSTENDDLHLSATYTYTNDLLTKIQTPSTAYNFTYDSFGLRTNVKVGTQNLATYSYTDDRNFYLQSLDYGNGDSVDYTYDSKGRLTSQTYEDGDTVTYQYDNDGALAVMVDFATGITTRYYYDFTGRTIKYTETADGYSHSVGYDYDDINNLISQVETINGVEHTTTYTYDNDNRVKSKTTDGITVEYTYDTLGRITQQVTKDGDTTIVTETYTFNDNSGQVNSYRTQMGSYDVTYSYTYDDNGNILTVSDGTKTTNYIYDSQNQLIRENNPVWGFTKTWNYDNAGNILTLNRYDFTTDTLVTPKDTEAYTYDNSDWGDQLITRDGKSIAYDEIGNPESYLGKTFTWEHGRQLSRIHCGSSTGTYTYNANGMRTERTYGVTSYKYVYNGTQLACMEYICGSADILLEFTYDAQGVPQTITFNGTRYYYATNLQGDVLGIFNSDGTMVARYLYDAWGACAMASSSFLGQINPLRYRGYVYDQEYSCYYLQSRYYDPFSGRFINEDALAATGQGFIGNNMFAYCNNNPTNACDPCGTCIHRLDFWNDCAKCKGKTSGEKWYDFGIGFSKTAAKILPFFNALFSNVDAYAGVGLGLQGDVNLIDEVEVTAGVAYDVAGVRIKDGKAKFMQRYYNGADATLIIPITDDWSDEKYREVAFNKNIQWEDDLSPSNITLFSFGGYVFAGFNVRISFDLNSFLDEIHDVYS